MAAYRSSTNPWNGNAEFSSKTCLLGLQSKEVRNAKFSPWLFQEHHSTNIFFITQADILEMSLYVYSLFPEMLIGPVGWKAIPNVKLLPSTLYLRIILFSKEIKAHFIISTVLPSLQQSRVNAGNPACHLFSLNLIAVYQTLFSISEQVWPFWKWNSTSGFASGTEQAGPRGAVPAQCPGLCSPCRCLGRLWEFNPNSSVIDTDNSQHDLNPALLMNVWFF